jgi:hypothetical protein
MVKMKIFFILTLFSVNLFSQMLPMENRYTQIYKNLEKNEYKKELITLITSILENQNLIQETSKILENSFENKILKDKIIVFLVSVIYDANNSIQLKNAFNELLEDEEFKTQIVKIIKTEKDSKKIFILLKDFFIKKIDKRFNKIFKTFLNDKFLCQHNIDLTFTVVSKNLINENIGTLILDYYKENNFPDKYKESLKQQLVSLPYDYSIDSWFKDYYKKTYTKIKEFFLNERNSKFIMSEHLEALELNTIYSILNNQLFLDSYKKEFYNEFISDKVKLKKALKSLIIDDSDTLFEKINEKRFNCFHLDEKMIRIDFGLLSLFLKSILGKKEIELNVLPIFFESLK